jgi:uncharacterized protein YqjF (DUF2071 family)
MDINGILQTVDHRPWPLPQAPWVMNQSWHDLLFAHWPIPVETMRRLVPAALEVDTFDGWAWIGVVPFRMSNVYPRYTFAMPWLSAFPELNVRTYVRATGDTPEQAKAGVYFFGLEAANPLAVAIARISFKLPYFYAEMQLVESGATIHYRSRRIHRGAPPAQFAGRYRPTGAVYQSTPGTLEAWLTERYCLYTVNRRQRALRGEIHHLPWPLQPAEAEIEINTMAQAAGIELPDRPPLLHFARRLDVVVWPLHQVSSVATPL